MEATLSYPRMFSVVECGVAVGRDGWTVGEEIGQFQAGWLQRFGRTYASMHLVFEGSLDGCSMQAIASHATHIWGAVWRKS